MAAQGKQIVSTIQPNADNTYTIPAVESGEQQVILDFGGRVNYKVVKLSSLTGLPPQDDGPEKKPITWISNFGVMDPAGNDYLPQVNYTVFMPATHPGQTFVHNDKTGLHTSKVPKSTGSKPQKDNMLQVDFSTGDPGIGWK